jgi:hypothetical protein
MTSTVFEMSVYSNGQWRDCHKPEYIVKGSLEHLRAFCERWIARDMAIDETGHVEYHVFELDPNAKIPAGVWNRQGEPMGDLLNLIHPGMFETCQHGMSADGCYGPNHWADE